jgi:hypothetical protein
MNLPGKKENPSKMKGFLFILKDVLTKRHKKTLRMKGFLIDFLLIYYFAMWYSSIFL